MKKTLVIISLLVLCVCASAQERKYIFRDTDRLFKRELFVTEPRDGVLEYHPSLANYANLDDSVRIVMTRADCMEMQQSLIELARRFAKWSRAAKFHKVKDHSRPMGISFPMVRFEWREKEDGPYRYKTFSALRVSELVEFPSPDFVVSEKGRCSAKFFITLETEHGKEYKFKTTFNSVPEINDFIRLFDVDLIDSMLKPTKAKPKSYYDSIFK